MKRKENNDDVLSRLSCAVGASFHRCDTAAAVAGVRYGGRIKEKKHSGRLIKKRLYFSLGSFIESVKVSHFFFPLLPPCVTVEDL